MSKLLQHTKLLVSVFVCGFLIACSEPQSSAEAEVQSTSAPQQTVNEKYTWDLTDLYPDNEAWNSARLQAAQQVEVLAALKGTLGNSAK